MSRIDKLIAQLCPDGVEFKRLGELGRRNTGVNITAAEMKRIAVRDGGVRVFAGGNTVANIASDNIPESCIIREPSIIVKSRGYIGFEFYEKPFSHKNELWSYSINSPGVSQKFVYYYLLTQVNKLQKLARATSVKIPQLSVGDTDNLKIPVPPLEAQREIVKVLDTFTKLEARRRQYTYYRDALLMFSECTDSRKPQAIIPETRWMTLGEIVTISRGASPRPIHAFLDRSGGGVPWIKIGDVAAGNKYITDAAEYITAAGAEKSRKIFPGDFLLSNSMSFGRPYISRIEGCVHDGWLIISAWSQESSATVL